MTRARLRRIVLTLVVLDVVVLLAAAAAWVLLSGGDERANVVNDGLRGSRPPAGGRLPDLSPIAMMPPFPPAAQVRGRVTAVAATCMACRSGDVLGGFLGRLQPGDVPEHAQLHVLVWEGRERGRDPLDADAWRRQWQLDGRRDLRVHEVRAAGSITLIQRELGLGDGRVHPTSGVIYLYDDAGSWRSSWFLGQLDRAGLRHDLERLSTS